MFLRVGRNAGYSFIVKNEYVGKYISDYFYILKGITFNEIGHLKIRKLLFSKRKGIASSYLHKEDILLAINEVLSQNEN